jgi:DNA-binding NarL/FixJ family response regulator
VRVLVVGERRLWRQSLALLLRQALGAQAAETAPEGQAQLLDDFRPEVVVALEGAGVGQVPSEVGLVLLGADHGAMRLVRSRRGRRVGLLSPEASVEELCEAVRQVGAGKGYLHPSLVEGVLSDSLRPRPVGLSRRELQVLSLLGRGLRNRDIGRELFISEKTVKNHVYHICRKLGAMDRTQAVVRAIETGWLQVTKFGTKDS